jgi:hypothetical protein
MVVVLVNITNGKFGQRGSYSIPNNHRVQTLMIEYFIRFRLRDMYKEGNVLITKLKEGTITSIREVKNMRCKQGTLIGM